MTLAADSRRCCCFNTLVSSLRVCQATSFLDSPYWYDNRRNPLQTKVIIELGAFSLSGWS